MATKAEKELANQEITTTIDNLRKEQKKEREQNKHLKAELKELVNELFTLPELRSKAQRLLNQAVEAATQELTTKNFSQTELSFNEKPIKRVSAVERKSSGAEADSELSTNTVDANKDSVSEHEVEMAEIETDVDETENDGASYVESTTDIDENDKDCYDYDAGVPENQFDEAGNKSLCEDLEESEHDLENSTNLFEDVFWHEEENMAKHISDANEQLLKVLNENFQDQNFENVDRSAYENPFEIDKELSNIYAEKLKKLEETTASVRYKMTLSASNEESNASSEVLELSEQNSNSEIGVARDADEADQREIDAKALLEVDCMFKEIEETIEDDCVLDEDLKADEEPEIEDELEICDMKINLENVERQLE